MLPVLYLTVAGSLVAYVLMTWLLKQCDATSVSFVTVVIPVA